MESGNGGPVTIPGPPAFQAPEPRLSVVIPAHNEEKYLPRLLAGIAAARARYRRGAGAVEVVVADNESTDGTAEVSLTRGCKVVPVSKRVIAAARNGGARASKGEILAFVDADSMVHPDTFNAIEAALEGEKVVGGATGMTMERWSTGIALTYVALVPLVRILGVDGGVVFCRREDFIELGGYDESRLYAEDVDFLLKLKRFGRRRGQRFERLQGVKAVASARKFDRHGDWHYFSGMLRFAWGGLFDRASLQRLIRTYWYDDPR